MINQEKKVSRAAPHFERESSSPLKSPVSKPPTEGVKHDDEILSNNVKNEVIAFLFFFLLIVVVVQLLSHVQLFATPWTAAHQASLSPTISRSLLKLTSIELVMPSHCLILCLPGLIYSLVWLHQVLVVTLGISGPCCSLWGL